MKLEFSHPSVGTVSLPLPGEGELVLGRDTEEADFELPWDPHVSRRHAVVRIQEGRCFYEDLGSTNGSRLNGQRLNQPVELTPGMFVQLGDTSLALILVSSGPWAEVTEADGPLMRQPEVQVSAVPRSPPSSPSTDLDGPRVRFVGPTRVRIEGDGLQLLWKEELSQSRLFVPGPVPARRGTRVWVDIALEEGIFELSAQVVHIGEGPSGLQGAGLSIGSIPSQLAKALTRGAGSTATSTVEIRRPPEIIPAPLQARIPRQVSEASQVSLEERAQAFVSLVVSNRLYEALGVKPVIKDADLNVCLARWRALIEQPPRTATFSDLKAPFSRALDLVESNLGEPLARLRYDFAHGHTFVKRRLDLAARGEGPSIEILASSWRRAFPARFERARRLWASAEESASVGRTIEAEQLRAQARSLAPFQFLDDSDTRASS